MIFMARPLSSARREARTLTMTFPPAADKRLNDEPAAIPKLSRCRLCSCAASTFLTVSYSPTGASGKGIFRSSKN